MKKMFYTTQSKFQAVGYLSATNELVADIIDIAPSTPWSSNIVRFLNAQEIRSISFFLKQAYDSEYRRTLTVGNFQVSFDTLGGFCIFKDLVSTYSIRVLISEIPGLLGILEYCDNEMRNFEKLDVGE